MWELVLLPSLSHKNLARGYFHTFSSSTFYHGEKKALEHGHVEESQHHLPKGEWPAESTIRGEGGRERGREGGREEDKDLSHSLQTGSVLGTRFQSFAVAQSSVVSDSLWPRELQHARLPCASPTPGACSDSRPLSQWCFQSLPRSFMTLPQPSLSACAKPRTWGKRRVFSLFLLWTYTWFSKCLVYDSAFQCPNFPSELSPQLFLPHFPRTSLFFTTSVIYFLRQ